MARFVWMGIALQLAMVVAGHFSGTVLNLSGLLGTGIPFVLGVAYGLTGPRSWGEAAKGGFVIGIVGATLGVLAAILMGDQTWLLLTFAPLSSGLTGLLGALVGRVGAARVKAAGA